MDDLFLDIDLVTAGYLAHKNLPLPPRNQHFPKEDIEKMKDKVAKYMTSPFNEAADSLQAFREKIG